MLPLIVPLTLPALSAPPTHAGGGTRQPISMSAMMREHMRDHLLAISEIQAAGISRRCSLLVAPQSALRGEGLRLSRPIKSLVGKLSVEASEAWRFHTTLTRNGPTHERRNCLAIGKLSIFSSTAWRCRSGNLALFRDSLELLTSTARETRLTFGERSSCFIKRTAKSTALASKRWKHSRRGDVTR